VVEHRHRRLAVVGGDLCEGGAEAVGVAVDDRQAEIGLRREVIVDAGLADAEGVGNVLVAERVVAARLDQRLGDVEDVRCGVRSRGRGFGGRGYRSGSGAAVGA
jgi:hypothetical protein